MSLLTLLQADKLMREVVAGAGPEFCYTAPKGIGVCQYVNEGKPDCVVGRILHRHGVPLTTLSLWEGATASEMGQRTNRRGLPPLMTEEAAQLLEDLQDRQDARRPWGEAMEHALTAHRDFSYQRAYPFATV